MICAGMQGNLFEIDSTNSTVWEYINPVSATGILSQGDSAIQNLVFRCEFYDLNYPGLNGHALIAGNPIELNHVPYSCNMINDVNENQTSISINVTNPFTDFLQVRCGDDMGKCLMELYDMTGKRVWVDKAELNKHSETIIPLNKSLASGLYYLKFTTGEKSFTTKLVTVE
jgi:hypothetical protein